MTLVHLERIRNSKARSEERKMRLNEEQTEMELAVEGNTGARAREFGDGRLEMETD